MLPLVEEPAAAMRPTRDFGDRTGRNPPRTIQCLEPGIAIGLQEPGERGHVRGRVLATTVGTVEVCGSRRCDAAERPVVAHVDPQTPGLGPTKSRCQHPNRRVVAVDLLGGEDMTPDRRHHRVQQPGRLSNPIAQRRAIEFEPLSRIDLALSIQRQMVAIFRHQQMRQRGRRGTAAWRRHRWSWSLRDGVARAAGEFRPHVTDDLEVPRHVIQHLGDVLAQFGHPATTRGAAAGAVTRRLMDNILARQMIGQRLALRLVGARGR